jgi:hypothetical protein
MPQTKNCLFEHEIERTSKKGSAVLVHTSVLSITMPTVEPDRGKTGVEIKAELEFQTLYPLCTECEAKGFEVCCARPFGKKK